MGRTTLITKAKEDDPIPTLEEIQEKLYPTKKIDRAKKLKVIAEGIAEDGSVFYFEQILE